MSMLDISEATLNALPEPAKSQVKALLNIRQGLFDILGAYPQENVLPYFYGLSRTTAQGNAIAANTTETSSIRITADAGFIARALVGTSTGDYLFFMRTDSSDRQLENVPIHSTAGVGTAQRPGMLHKPLLMPPSTTLTIDFTDVSGAQNEIYWFMAGFKIYNRRIN